jgi:hypothetical protein
VTDARRRERPPPRHFGDDDPGDTGEIGGGTHRRKPGFAAERGDRFCLAAPNLQR